MPVPLGQRGLQHDTHADSRSHGGADKAVLAYSGDHYPDWSSRLDLPLLQPGGFGENLTVSGLTEEDVCLGDRWRVREIELEVSQPRQPCAKLGLRWRLPALTSLVAESGRTGWYLRVRRGGVLSAPAVIERIARPHPEWTVARANACLFGDRATRGEFAELLAIPELSGEWKRSLG